MERARPVRPVAVVRAGVGGTAVLAAVAGGLLVTPGAALAHGPSSGRTTGDFVWLGFTHMLLDWDHLLFAAAVVLLAGQVKRSAALVTVFAAGHTLTLTAATLAGWRFNTALVDIVIALSLAFVGVVGWSGRPARWWWFAAAVFGFGFVHGLGLSTGLQNLGVHHEGVLARVVAVSVGVEIGQLVAVLGVFILGDVLWHHLRPHVSRPAAWRVVHAGLMVVGLVAGAVLAAGAGPDGPEAVISQRSPNSAAVPAGWHAA